MKKQPSHFTRFSCVAAIAASCFFVTPATVDAKDKDKGKDHGNSRGSSHSSSRSSHSSHRDNDRDRGYYHSRPRSSFVLSLGDGYAGRGYYYGPPGAGYYYQRPEVRYYATRELAPREYYVRDSYGTSNTAVAVQRALARAGYYRGEIDGDIGPGSRNAIARYQANNGLTPTGTITSSLLRSLGL